MREECTHAATWIPWGPDHDGLPPGQPHVIVWKTPDASECATLTRDIELLDSLERARAGRFVSPRHRVAYIASHARMRSVLGSYSGQEPVAVCFARDKGGKPQLAGTEPRLQFNLSHTQGWGALVVSAGSSPVGIDIELVRPIEREIAEKHFSAREQSELNSLAGREWLEAFFRGWTRKEAVLKGEGAGLSVPLNSFDVSLADGSPAGLVTGRAASGFRQVWRLTHFDLDAAVTGAVATASDQVCRFFLFA